jgi:hypothetical protein
MRIGDVFKAAWSKLGVGLKWARTVLSERDGTGSTSRVVSLLVTLTICGVLIGHLVIRRTLPDPGTLGGLAGLLTAGAAGYGVNKATNRD